MTFELKKQKVIQNLAQDAKREGNFSSQGLKEELA